MFSTSRVESPARPPSPRWVRQAAIVAGILLMAGASVTGVHAQAANAPGPAAAAGPTAAVAGTGDAEVGADESRWRLVYSVNRTPERPFDTTRAVQVITREDIWRRAARTLPELLMNEAGLFVQQTNYGGGSPIVRGLMGKQVVILVDGVRINNATFRFGPLQYLNTIDLSSVERIEIVRGVESVLGSDSLGGLVNVILKKGPPSRLNQAFGGTVSTRFSTADTAVTSHAEVFDKVGGLRYSAGATYRDTGDVRPGGGLAVQREQAYDEWAAALNAEYSLSPSRTVSVRFHSLEQDKVPGASRTATTTYLVNEPQTLQLLTFEYQDLAKHRFLDQVQITGYVNRQQEGQIEVRSGAANVERRNLDVDRVLGASLQLATYLGGSHRLLYGFDYSTEQIDSIRHDVDVVTNAVAIARGKYTDNSSYDAAAVYVQDRFNLTKWVTTSVGARYGRTSAAGTENSKVAVLDLSSTQDGLTGSVGVSGHLTPGLNAVASVTRGFRPPNIDDLSRYEERKEGVEVPNPALDPERSLTYEVGLKFDSAHADGSAFYYQSELRDLHDRRAGIWNGLPFFDLNGSGARDANEPQVLQRVNVGRATIRGFEFDGRLRLTTELSLSGNYTTTRGDDHVLNEPLSRIPPAFGWLSVHWSPVESSRRIWSEFAYTFAADQRRVSTRDKGDARIGPAGTDGFNVISVRGGFDLARQVRVVLGVENLLDEAYKYHASGIMRPGRQFVVGTEFGF